MQISLILAQQIAELFLILLIGCVLVKARLLKSADSRVLSVVMVYAVMPCVIINAFQVDYSPAVVTGLLYAFALGDCAARAASSASAAAAPSAAAGCD